MKIKNVFARQILDSRGNPTIECKLVTIDDLNNSYEFVSKVPSGASTGIYEALELRDNNKKYFLGKSVIKAVKNIKEVIAPKLIGKDVESQNFDDFLKQLDGTKNKSNLGANAILGVSMNIHKAIAYNRNLPLYQYFSKITNREIKMPYVFANVINGGKHAGGDLKFQEFMIVPRKKTVHENIMVISETYHILKKIIEKRYGKSAVNIGDEGGFAPGLSKASEALDLLEEAISESRHSNTMIAMDVAASEYFEYGKYFDKFTPEELIAYYVHLVDKYPRIISIEDPFDQDDFSSFKQLLPIMKEKKVQIVGDDLLVTNAERILMSLDKDLVNALLLKINQIGTIDEALTASNLAFSHDWNVMVSHRSGETDDSFISDLAVGIGSSQIKIGAPARGERVAKYNRLLEIEEEYFGINF
jgi:enolase